MTSVIDCRTHPKDLLAQKLISPSRVVASVLVFNLRTDIKQVQCAKVKAMDFGILGGIALIIIWAFGALAFDGPGWIHLLSDRRCVRDYLANCRARRPATSRTQVTRARRTCSSATSRRASAHRATTTSATMPQQSVSSVTGSRLEIVAEAPSALRALPLARRRSDSPWIRAT